MYICICNAITDNEIREAARNGVRTMAELTQRTGCSDECGQCACDAEAILKKEISKGSVKLRIVSDSGARPARTGTR